MIFPFCLKNERIIHKTACVVNAIIARTCMRIENNWNSISLATLP